MNKLLFSVALILSIGLSEISRAGVVTITSLDVRSNGVFGHADVSDYTINGNSPSGTVVADPLNLQMTYSNLDLDDDGTANDSVTFTLTAAKAVGGSGGNLRIFGQGIDTGFGNLNDVTVTMTSVVGITTDFRRTIMFDGFVGANVGAGSSAVVDRNVEINGTNVSIFAPSTGDFQFFIDGIDFAATDSVTFDNSGGTSGSIVIRSYDLMFSAIPEPSSVAMFALAGSILFWRRRN